MSKADRIVRLRAMGLDLSTIARLCNCTRLDVIRVLARCGKLKRRPWA